jgi:hypothetical protein
LPEMEYMTVFLRGEEDHLDGRLTDGRNDFADQFEDLESERSYTEDQPLEMPEYLMSEYGGDLTMILPYRLNQVVYRAAPVGLIFNPNTQKFEGFHLYDDVFMKYCRHNAINYRLHLAIISTFLFEYNAYVYGDYVACMLANIPCDQIDIIVINEKKYSENKFFSLMICRVITPLLNVFFIDNSVSDIQWSISTTQAEKVFYVSEGISVYVPKTNITVTSYGQVLLNLNVYLVNDVKLFATTVDAKNNLIASYEDYISPEAHDTCPIGPFRFKIDHLSKYRDDCKIEKFLSEQGFNVVEIMLKSTPIYGVDRVINKITNYLEMGELTALTIMYRIES